MRILYLAPRYHTNQTAVIRGWHKHGDDVKFISYYTAPIEDYTDLKPTVLGFAPWYTAFYHFYADVLHRNERNAMNNKIQYGYPPAGRLKKEILDFKPDIAILRERTIYTMKAYAVCRAHGIPCILYNQSPMWDEPPKTDLRHQYVYKHTPSVRMTPVMGIKGEGRIIAPGSYYVPFAVEPASAPAQRKYFDGGRINILCVGKYEPRKHHIMLMDAVAGIYRETGIDMHLTIIGEASGRLQKEYYSVVEEHYHTCHMEQLVTLMKNVPSTKMPEIYSRTDVFVIPSTREMASVSQLEAMSYSVPVICSDKNGTACYVEDGRDGYLFKDCDADDLYAKVRETVVSRTKITDMGRNAYEDVASKYTFKNYYDNILKIINENRWK
jgi:glycosyltransferase involved in cell wall biosynthesis